MISRYLWDFRGNISYFPTRKPTNQEYRECRHMELTADSPDWDPHSRLFDANENAMTDEEGYIKRSSRRRTIMKMKTDAGLLVDANNTSKSISAVSAILSKVEVT
jgi:hypothetical protein